MTDRHSTTLADAARAARDEEGRPDPELTEAEAREQMDPAPIQRCTCGEPLHRRDGWTLLPGYGCAVPSPQKEASQ